MQLAQGLRRPVVGPAARFNGRLADARKALLLSSQWRPSVPVGKEGLPYQKNGAEASHHDLRTNAQRPEQAGRSGNGTSSKGLRRATNTSRISLQGLGTAPDHPDDHSPENECGRHYYGYCAPRPDNPSCS